MFVVGCDAMGFFMYWHWLAFMGDLEGVMYVA